MQTSWNHTALSSLMYGKKIRFWGSLKITYSYIFKIKSIYTIKERNGENNNMHDEFN
jgi:hypothetical protein